MTKQQESKIQALTSPQEDDRIAGYPFSVHFGELLFTILPFSVLFLVYLFQEKSFQSYLFAPEWAFASAILFGQTVVKFVQGIVESTHCSGTISERVGLLVAVLIVVGLVPSMIILALLLTSSKPPFWVGVTQIVLFFVSALSFVVLGSVAHSEAAKARNVLAIRKQRD